MAVNYGKTTENLTKLKDLTIEQKAVVKKSIIVDGILERGVFGQFVDEEKYAGNHSSVSWRKLVIPELSYEDIKFLEEGMTPKGSKMTYAEYVVATKSYGDYIEYTDEDVAFGYDNIVSDARVQLGEHAKQVKELRYVNAFGATTRTVTLDSTGSTEIAKIDNTLAKARNQLRKNGAKFIRGSKYACIAPIEFVSKLALLVADKFDGSEKNAILKEGYIGTYGGFDFYEDVNGKAGTNAFFFGKSARGSAVKDIKIGSGNLTIETKKLGEVAQAIKDETGAVVDVRADHLGQRGSVGYKVMGTMPTLVEDGLVLKCNLSSIITSVSAMEEGASFGSVTRTAKETSPAL